MSSLLKKYQKKYPDVTYEVVEIDSISGFYKKTEAICLKDEYGNLHSYNDAPSFVLLVVFCLFGKKIKNNLEVWHKYGKYIRNNFVEEEMKELDKSSCSTLGLFDVETSEIKKLSEEEKNISDSVFREISLSSFPPGTYGYWKHNTNKLNKEELEEYYSTLENQEKILQEENQYLSEKNIKQQKQLETSSNLLKEEQAKNTFLEEKLLTLKKQNKKLKEDLEISSNKIKELKKILLEIREYHHEIESERQKYQEIETANLEKDGIILELETKINKLEKRDSSITIKDLLVKNKDLLLEVKDQKLITKISFGAAGLIAALFLGFSFLF